MESRIDASPESLGLELSDIDLLAAFRTNCVARLLQLRPFFGSLVPVFRYLGARFSGACLVDMYPRFIEPGILEAFKNTRVVAVAGPRQSGKSTLVRAIIGIRTMDDPHVHCVFLTKGQFNKLRSRLSRDAV